MSLSRNTRRGWRAGVAATVVASLGALGLAAAPAQAASASVSGASLSWTMNDETGGGAHFGGCNFLSAGTAGNAGSSRLWTESDGFYAAQSGNVRIEKPTAAGGWGAPTWATKCTNAAGATVTPQPGSTTGNRVVYSAGTGNVDLATNTGSITWNGSYTIVFYGGLTYWTISNPTLTVTAGGVGTLTASGSGYAASKDSPSTWVPIAPEPITLANLTGVQLTASGFTATPAYAEVAVATPNNAQVRTGASWGAFPQSFVTFQEKTGQGPYWYSSGVAADPKKVAKGLEVGYELGKPTISTQPASVTAEEGTVNSLSVVATGDGTLAYKWESSTNGTDWTAVSGGTTANLNVIPKLADNGKKYRVVVSYGTASVTSAVATVSVIAANITPKVTLDKSTIDVNGDHVVTVTGTGFKPNYATGTRPPLAGQASGTYVIFGKFAQNWKPSAGAAGTTRPVAVQKWAVPQSAMNTVGGEAGGAVLLNTDGSFTTQLTVSKSDADTKSAAITDGIYGVFTYAGGGAWQPAYETYTPISFIGAPVISTQPASVTAEEGTVSPLSVVATGDGTLAYKWESSTNGTDWTAVSGGTTANLNVIPKLADNGKKYRVSVINAISTVISDPATLSVVAANITPQVTVDKTELAADGSTVVTVSGTGFKPNYATGTRPPLAGQAAGAYVIFGKFAQNWKPSAGAAGSTRPVAVQKWAVTESGFETVGGADGGAVLLNADGSFTAQLVVSKSDADTKSAAITDGIYGVFTYAGGGSWQPAYETYTPITFVTEPVVATHPAAQSVTVGGSTTFSVAATPVTDGLTYQWEKSSNGTEWTNVVGANEATLSVRTSAVADSGTQYRAVVTNAAGTVASNAAALTITKAAVTVKAIAGAATYGKTSQVTVVVSAPSGIAPTGTVTVKAGSKSVSANLVAGKATVTLHKVGLAAGRRSVAISYSGNANLDANAATASVTVKKASAKATVTLSKKTIKAKKKAKVSVKVTATGVSAVSGKVTVTLTAKGVKTIKKTVSLKNGKGSFTTSSLKKKGKYTVKASYLGNSNVSKKAAKPAVLKVK